MTTVEIYERLDTQLVKNVAELQETLKNPDTTISSSKNRIYTYTKGVREIDDVAGQPVLSLSGEPVKLDITFKPNSTTEVRDKHDSIGIILTGKWIIDYAQKIKLVPQYEKTLASYKSQNEIQKQIISEYDGVIAIKDKKNSILSEMSETYQEQRDLYKTMAEIKSEHWYERIFRKIAFPAGLVTGIYLGILMAENN